MYKGTLIFAAVVALVCGGASLFFAGRDATAASNQTTVVIGDACDPVTFNAAVGPGTCSADPDKNDGERVTFDEFINEILSDGEGILADQRLGAWRFNSSHPSVDAGGTLMAVNEGHEFHTFTEVADFGGGCVPELNALLGLSPVAECAAEFAPGVPLVFVTTGLPPGASMPVSGLSQGTHMFQCMIHPWMRSTATVK